MKTLFDIKNVRKVAGKKRKFIVKREKGHEGDFGIFIRVDDLDCFRR